MATYPDAEVRADRDRAADEMVIALSQPEVAAQQALRRRMFAGHPYATPLPTPAALRRVKAPELKLLHSAPSEPCRRSSGIGGRLSSAAGSRRGRGSARRMARGTGVESTANWLRWAHYAPGRSSSSPERTVLRATCAWAAVALPVGPALAGGVIGRQRAGRHVHLSHHGEPPGTQRLLIFAPRPVPSFAGGLDVRAGRPT